MKKVFAYKIVRGELRLKDAEDQQKVLRLMEAWRNAINDVERRE